MKSITPKIWGYVLILLSLPIFFTCAMTLLMSLWVCGDAIVCNLTIGDIIPSILIDLGALAVALGAVLAIVSNFKLSSALNENPGLVVQKSFYTSMISFGAAIILTIVYLNVHYGDDAYMVLTGICMIVSLSSSILFLRHYKDRN